LDKNNHRRSSLTDFALPSPGEGPIISWQRFNYEKTFEWGGQNLYQDLILGNFVSHSVRAPCTMREVVEQIARHSQKPIPIDALAGCLSQPVLPRSKVFFGSPGTCVDQVVGNYDNLEWWVSSKGLNVSIGNSASVRENFGAQYS
jgi:hypothetical protein